MRNCYCQLEAVIVNSGLGPCSTLRPIFIPPCRILWDYCTFPEYLLSCEYFCFIMCVSDVPTFHSAIKKTSLGENSGKIVVETV